MVRVLLVRSSCNLFAAHIEMRHCPRWRRAGRLRRPAMIFLAMMGSSWRFCSSRRVGCKNSVHSLDQLISGENKGLGAPQGTERLHSDSRVLKAAAQRVPGLDAARSDDPPEARRLSTVGRDDTRPGFPSALGLGEMHRDRGEDS